ncbi:copper transporter [Isoptericola sp. S6320L]|uniref:copper transporter n=1 Tax=Isoptericola sp. S6320L TaxID=2926411 RepID=UPI001FF12E9B|nr:copper transporter [Isoptericola sp. S6320L]MCK0115932.1 copper transporter [Isoptericola sp. S6320L]
MIDFRYHLVSLISVFVALAVGIILGAGPLQNAIGDQLTDQVEALRAERTDLRESLVETESELIDQNAYALAAGAELVAGSLEGVTVAVVDAGDAADTLEADVVSQLEAAGARIVAQASLTGAWSSAEDSVLRGTVADGQREHVADAIDEEAGTAEVLGAVLGLAMTEPDPQVPSERSERSVELYELMLRVGLVESRFEPSGPADAVLLLGGAVPEEGATADTEGAEEPEDVDVVAVVSALQATAEDVVVAGPTTAEGDMVSDVRADEDVAARVSTVSGTEREVMRLNVPLALAAQIAGEVGQYGFEEDATVVPPAVELPAPDQDTSGETDGGAGTVGAGDAGGDS